MAGNYWIKLYVEVLDDPKMATLPDRLWRRFYELCLMAGRENKDGELPGHVQIAWALRMSADDLLNDIEALVRLGLITEIPNGYLVTQFAKRQKKMSNAEKTERYRESKKQDEYKSLYPVTEPVTDVLLKVTQITDNRLTDTDTDTETDTELTGAGAVFEAYESEIGALTPIIREKINSALDDYPSSWILDGITESVQHNARNWSYIEAILKRWKAEGKVAGKKPEKARTKGRVGHSYEEGIDYAKAWGVAK
jgi:DnaD/phage-associated family protein